MYYSNEKNRYLEKIRKSEKGVAGALERAHDLRKFEIDLYWKRSTNFWTFISIVLGAYGYVLFNVIGNGKLGKEQAYQFILLALPAFGAILSYAWVRVNDGGKFWQQNWEIQVDVLEDEVNGPLVKTIFAKDKQKYVDPIFSEKYLKNLCVVLLIDFGLHANFKSLDHRDIRRRSFLNWAEFCDFVEEKGCADDFYKIVDGQGQDQESKYDLTSLFSGNKISLRFAEFEGNVGLEIHAWGLSRETNEHLADSSDKYNMEYKPMRLPDKGAVAAWEILRGVDADLVAHDRHLEKIANHSSGVVKAVRRTSEVNMFSGEHSTSEKIASPTGVNSLISELFFCIFLIFTVGALVYISTKGAWAGLISLRVYNFFYNSAPILIIIFFLIFGFRLRGRNSRVGIENSYNITTRRADVVEDISLAVRGYFSRLDSRSGVLHSISSKTGWINDFIFGRK